MNLVHRMRTNLRPKRNPAPVKSDSGRLAQVELLLCHAQSGRVDGVWVRQSRTGIEGKAIAIEAASTDGLDIRLGREARIVALLPKSKYLLKTVQIPRAQPNDVAAMIALELRSAMPPDFGPMEISFRALSGHAGDLVPYEVYVAREKDLADYMADLTAHDLRPHVILPSAVAWDALFRTTAGVHVLVAMCADCRTCEAAFPAEHTGAVRVQVVQRDAGPLTSGLDPGLIGCIRSALSESHEMAGPLNVGWLGSGCPTVPAGGRIRVEDLSALQLQRLPQMNGLLEAVPFLRLSAAALMQALGAEPLQTANLLPHKIVIGQHRRAIYRGLIVAVACFLLGLALIYATLASAALRYRTANRHMAEQIAAIREEGEAVERRHGQLRAVYAARASMADLHEVVAGLIEVTPAGITYSSVELAEDGELHLRGQAESVSLPFLLPEKLEALPAFEQVVLQTVGQSTQGAGSVAEFRLDARLARKASHP